MNSFKYDKKDLDAGVTTVLIWIPLWTIFVCKEGLVKKRLPRADAITWKATIPLLGRLWHFHNLWILLALVTEKTGSPKMYSEGTSEPSDTRDALATGRFLVYDGGGRYESDVDQ